MPDNPLPTPTPPKPSTPPPASAPVPPPSPPAPSVPTPPPAPATPVAPTTAPLPPKPVVTQAATPAAPALPPRPPVVPPTPSPTPAPAAAGGPPLKLPPSRIPFGAPKPPTGPVPAPPPTQPGIPLSAAGAPPPMPKAPPVAAPLPSGAPTGKPALAKPRSSMFKFLPFIIGGLVLLGVVVFFLMRMLGGGGTPVGDGTTPGTTIVPAQTTTITYWGLWEPSEVMTQVFTDFEAANPGLKVNYIKQSPTDYRERLQTAMVQGTGPDVFRFHASWTPMLKDELAAVPSSVFSPAAFQSTFYPVASEQLTSGGQLRGIPLMYDGLALYYNEDMLKNADAQPPTTWADLRILATQLTVMNGDQVQRGGLAIGNASNVEHFSDILGLLMLQNGADLTNPTSPEAREALIFYTDFLKTYKVWSDDLPNSTVAFARGDVAMMFAPSWRAHEILAQNPNLKFGIAPLPKLGTSQAAWATYWAEGVNTKSRNKDAAWKLLAYLSQPEVMQKMYTQQAGVRRFGEIYSRSAMATELVNEPLVAPYLSDAPQAKGWYMSSFTHDNGINDQIIKYYQDAINAVLAGTTPDNALITVAQGVAQVLRQYGVPVTAAAPAATTTTPGSQLSL